MTKIPSASSDSTIASIRNPFLRHLDSENRSVSTRITYGAAIDLLDAHLGPMPLADIRRADIEGFLISLRDKGQKPATLANRFRSLQQLFRWAVDEGELDISPMAKMKPPHVPEEPPALVTEADQKALLATCDGTSFEERRDAAILRLFLDTGMRRAELAGLKLDDLDLDLRTAVVMGKGSRPRACPYDREAATALDRYLRARRAHDGADSPWLWLGKKGRLNDSGIGQVVKRRAAQAGLKIHPHLFRHTYAHESLAAGMQEGDLMRLGGWRSRQMLDRYGASAAGERAIAAYRTLRSKR